jgi:hypothetical protein
LGQVNEVIGGVAHGAHDNDNIVAGLLGINYALGHALNAVSIGD